MATATPPAETVLVPEQAEEEDLRALGDRLVELESQHAAARLVGPTGEAIELPPSAFRALVAAIDALKRGMPVTLIPRSDALLTTKQAADLLRVSRPFLVQKLLGKEIPFERVGTHRRVRMDDLLEYREKRARVRRELLDTMAAESQAFAGGYR